MKHHYAIFVLIFLFAIAASPLKAQRTFDSKKRKPSPKAASAGISTRQRTSLSPATSFHHPLLSQSRNFKPLSLQRPHHILSRNDNTLPTFIETTRNTNASSRAGRKDIQLGSYDYLREIQSLTKLDRVEDFIIQNIQTDQQGKSHVRMQQYYKQIPVYGSEVIVHLNAFGEGEAFNGRYALIDDDIEITPSVSSTQAIARAQLDITKGKTWKALTSLERKLVQHEQPVATLCLYESKSVVKKHVLAYHVVSCPTLHARWEYFIDANTGNVLHQFNSTCFIDGAKTATANDLHGVSRTVNTYQKGSTYFMVDISRNMYKATGSVLPDSPLGGIMTIDLNNTFGDNAVVKHVTSTNNTWNANSVSAHFNAGVAYEYFRSNHARNGIDGEKGTIISIINTPDEDGTALDNAFWNGKAMFYGNGKVAFKPLAGAMDVAGHEMTHGVVENTAALEYQGESGAINESMADIFGSMMDPTDWLIGEDVVKTSVFTSGALRSMEDPHNGGTSLSHMGYQPKHMNEKYSGTQDNGGVHINSGIPNHAFYLYAEAIGREKAAKIFYEALSAYLTKSSQFIDLRLAVIKAANDLYSSTEATQAGAAFDAVGITNGTGGDFEETLPQNPGTEFLLVYNTATGDPNTLYRSSPSATNAMALTTTTFRSRPSVTDDGVAAVFVADDNTIHVIITEPGADPEEFVLDNREIWSNVVVSKGGARLAAVKSDQSNTIHVYDFNTEDWETFELYNPTYSEGVSSAGPLYADALEWDYTGEYLVYDAYNVIESSDGTDIEYWDVNFIHAWDKETNDFGSGEISKLFSSLPPGISIGNPSFSKNSPNVIAFDYVDESLDEYYILGMNIETNDVDVISENYGLGWPSYNKNDTRIAFTSDDGLGAYQTGFVTLKSNKITSNNDYTALFGDTQWPVYFAVGDRDIGEEVITSIEDRPAIILGSFPNPFIDAINVRLSKPFTPQTKVDLVNVMGQRILTPMIEQVDEMTVRVKPGDILPGTYILRITQGRAMGHERILKIR